MPLKHNNHKSSSPRGLVESNRNWNGLRTSGYPSSERSGSYLLSRDWGSAIKGAQNIGQSLPNRLILMIVLACQCSSSDFNVVIPEICNMTEASVNISWIHEMVLLGIREEQPQLSLNILGPQEICDGSNGLLKFISLAKEDKNGQMIASLEPHLCSTAATFRHLQGKAFVSWTCPKVPGVISIKPLTSDVILAINRLVKYLNWEKFAFAKSQLDKSSFCDEVGSQLQKEMETRPNNYSVLILGRYEDLKLSQYSSVMDSLQGLFLCISYTQGFTHNLTAKTELKYLSEENKLRDGRLPLVILPEWPLPLKLFSSSKDKSILALMSHPHPLNSPPPPPLDTDRKPSWESFAEFVPLESHDASTSPKKNIAEPLLARLILQSIKVSLEYEKMNGKNGGEEREGLDQSENLISSSVHPLETGGGSGGNSNNPNSVDEDGEKSRKDNDGFKEHKIMSFQFLVFQFDKDRWHPVINFILGDNVAMKSSSGMKREESTVITQGTTEERNRDSLVTWLQIIGATVLTVSVVGSIIGLSLYARERYQNQLYMQANTSHKKSLVPRIRNQGPYKLILTSRDICFGTYPVSNNDSNKKISKSFDGELLCSAGGGTATASSGGLLEPHTAANQRFLRAPSLDDSTEKPDLLKGSIGTLKKRLSIADIKNNDSMIMYENQARYKGDLVHVRKLTEPSDSFEIKAKAMNVLETVHGLRHENLVALIGLLTDGIPSMVWEYCSRGSLHDVIKQQDIKLDWAFKLSLLTDLVRGMRYLHSSLVRVHGFLTSYNCVIDARWVLKVTDYGILSFHHTQGIPLSRRSPKELLWTAPELLRDENLRKHGTQPGDVYSFAIIMQELLVRGEPYFMLPLSAEDILEKVKRPPPLIRPSVSKGAAPPEAINIMRQCWAEIPDMRPDFMVIHDLFKTLNHGRKANIVDTMFQMLEKYSNNLEELIRERTEQLDLEKKKTEQLLNRMLPSTVAEKLKVGLPVDPEDFSEVTIYFSDIVGFTTISAYSTPFEVVDLLNDLYTCFDATINDYNVYKVETIGDAYMVVGGAPVRSPDHSDQIATMALDLLYESGKFRIRHLPYTPLRLRIGIHTGPCCAGVVGLTMPRYCLFGDTVNTASRMESTGAPWRIHISCNTKSKLESIGGYRIEYRGVTDIKGKGKMPTYWLLGKEGFNKELPVPPKESEIRGLDEKSILYGRTGVRQEGDGASVNLKPEIVAFRDSRSNSQEGCSGGSNTLHVDPSGKELSAVAKVQGEALRCLSPAEEVAHQLLNGRPAVRGLRRQFSLDQGSNYYIPPVSRNRGGFRKTPSLEETSGDGHHHHYHNHNHHSSTSSLSIIPSSSSGKARLQHYSSVDEGKYHESSPTEANSSSSKSSSSFKHVTATKSNSIPSSGGDKSDNNELLPSNKSKITLSPRTGRIFIKSSSLTIVEESPTLE